MEHQDAIDTISELIYELEEDKYFEEHYSEELEECDFYNEQEMNEIPYKQLIEVTKDFSNSHYMMMRAVIESINKFKEDFEKEHKLKEAYKKVNKKQSDKIKQQKKEIEKLKEDEKNNKEIYEAQVRKLKRKDDKIDEQKKEIDTLNEQINKIVDLDSLVGTQAECDIQEIFNDEEEEDEGHYAVCETCDKKLFSDGQYSSITSCTYCDDCYEKLDSDEKE